MKKSKNIFFITAGVVVIVLIVAGFVVFHSSGNAVKNANTYRKPVSGSSYKAPAAPASAAGQKLSGTSYSNFAYQIFPGPLSAAAKTATTGFNITEKQDSNGTTILKLIALNSHFKNLTYNVSSGQKVYFIETNPAEDHTSSDYDMLYLDDHAVLTDSNGVIVQGPDQA